MGKLICMVLFCSGTLMAVPSDLGKYVGIIMTGAVIQSDMTFDGGSLYDCTQSDKENLEIFSCKVQGASLSIGGKPAAITFQKVSVVQKNGSGQYYFHGNRTIETKGFKFAQDISLISNLKSANKGQIWGFLDVSSPSTRSAFQAHLIP